jgi:hypothetical protein
VAFALLMKKLKGHLDLLDCDRFGLLIEFYAIDSGKKKNKS